ncbi:MAG: DUF2911 domain-containing protein [Thermoanaerobaculia bacterium]
MLRRFAAFLAMLYAVSAAPSALAQLQTPLPSPSATVAQTIGVTRVEVVYSRPHVKGPTRKEERVIWGTLVPYDKVWRTGANNVTKFTVDGDITVEGQKLAAGSYGLFTIPGKDEWTVIFNKQSTGSPADYKAEADVLRVKVKPQAIPMREMFTIGFPQVTTSSAELVLAWEKLAVVVNLAVDTNAQFLSNAKDAVAKAKPDDWRTALTAARYLYENKYAPADAAAYLDKSLSIKETFANLSTKAGVLAEAEKKKEAVAAAQKALAMKDADPKPSAEALADLEKKLAEWKAAK